MFLEDDSSPASTSHGFPKKPKTSRSNRILTTMVERRKSQDQVIDFGSRDAHGESLVSVLCGGRRATSLLAEHSR